MSKRRTCLLVLRGFAELNYYREHQPDARFAARWQYYAKFKMRLFC